MHKGETETFIGEVSSKTAAGALSTNNKYNREHRGFM